MDQTEDLSARVLLKHILSTEPPRTPITRSINKAQSPKRSSRLSNKDAVGKTPQDILRRSLRQKMRESITRKTLAVTNRKTATQRQSSTCGVSMTFDDDTPRHILRNILMTEPVRSPVVHKKTEPEEPQTSSANSSLSGRNASIELSGLDLPDVTMAIAPSVTKGLSRKRSRRSLNVTAFEKRLKGLDNVGEISEQSSLSFSSCTSLSLKTPLADVQTEKRGLQRRVSNRRKMTEEEFGAAVDKIELGGTSTFIGLCPSGTSYPEGFTVGLSKLSEPDITADIVHCDTALDAQPDTTTCDVSHSEEESRSRSHWKETETAPDTQTKEGGGDSQLEIDFSARSKYDEVEKETVNESQAAGRGVDESQREVDVCTGSRSEEKEGENPQDSQSEIDVSIRLRSEEEDGETAKESQAEEVASDSQPEVQDSARCQSEEEEEETTQEYQIANAQSKELSAADCHSEEKGNYADDDRRPKTLNREDFPHLQAEDGEQEEDGDWHESEEQEHEEPISYRDRCSGGRVTHNPKTDGDKSETGCSEDKSKATGTPILPINLEMRDDEIDQHHSGLAESSITQPDMEDPGDVADKENCSEGSRNSETAEQEISELEREWEDEEEEVPSKTPAFIREKRVFSQPFVKNIQPSAVSECSPAKSKWVRKMTRPAKREGGLPKSYLMNVFKHFAKTKVSADVYSALKEVMDKFFERMVEDLETYAGHAKRKTIEVEDVELLLKRQGHVNDKVPVEVLIEKYLRLDQRKLLIPIATSGNVVVPKRR